VQGVRTAQAGAWAAVLAWEGGAGEGRRGTCRAPLKLRSCIPCTALVRLPYALAPAPSHDVFLVPGGSKRGPLSRSEHKGSSVTGALCPDPDPATSAEPQNKQRPEAPLSPPLSPHDPKLPPKRFSPGTPKLPREASDQQKVSASPEPGPRTPSPRLCPHRGQAGPTAGGLRGTVTPEEPTVTPSEGPTVTPREGLTVTPTEGPIVTPRRG